MDGVDIYISTFAKSLATIGEFLAATREFMEYFKYNLRSQVFGRTLPIVDEEIGAEFINELRNNFGIFCRVVVYFIILKGLMTLRLIVTAFHDKNDIDETLEAFLFFKKVTY